MSHVFQVGAGSGGAVVLDLITRDPGITRITIVEPDVYEAHNVHRHIFPPSDVGRLKAELAYRWIHARRPDLAVDVLAADLTDPTLQSRFACLAAECDLGICAVDNEPAKYAFDALLRAAGKPWTLGEVLSGGIGGWVHRFLPGGPCYGCVASYLQRTVTEEVPAPPANYADPAGTEAQTTIPASKASIEAIASLHAVLTLELLNRPSTSSVRQEFTSLLLTLRHVPGVFDEPFRTYPFRIARRPDCLNCSLAATIPAGENLDAAVDQALARLAPN